MSSTRSRRGALVIAIALLIGACGDDDDATTTTTGPDSMTTTTAAPPATGNIVEVAIAGGEVVGGTQRVRVPAGEEVTIRVTSDRDDEVHVHGYDIEQAVTAGQPVDITFTADLGGVWQVELHELELVILELEVS